MIDNEVYSHMKGLLKKYKIKYQLAPPHTHLRNAAELAIRDFKNHSVVRFVTTITDLPINKWDFLIDKAVITFNLLWN